MPNVTEKKIRELNEPDLEGPPTQAETEAAFDGIYLGTKNTTMYRFHNQLDGFQPHTHYGITKTVPPERSINHIVNTCTTKHSKKCSSENNVPNGLKPTLNT